MPLAHLALLALIQTSFTQDGPKSTGSSGAALSGRVVDSSGKPVADAEIQVWRKVQREGKPVAENERVSFDTRDALTTDGAGRFQTPAALEPDQPIRVIAQADGMLTARSPWVKPGDKKVVDFGDIVLRRLRTVTGRVMDRHGNPIADATVFHAGDAHKSERTTTDADGRFSLPGVPEGHAFVFVEKTGFRFTGQLLGKSGEEVEIVVARFDEPVDPLRTLSPVLPREQELKLAREVLEPWLQAVARSKRDRDKFWGLQILAYVDPFEAFELVDRVGFSTETNDKEMTRSLAVSLMIKRASPNMLREIEPNIEAIEDPEQKTDCYRWGAHHMAAAEREAKKEWLDRALLTARGLKDPVKRAVGSARIADELFASGDEGRARRLVAEVQATVKELSDENRNELQACARAIVRIDPKAALQILERFKLENWYGFTIGDLAERLASRDPAEAERLWNLADERQSSDTTAASARDFGGILKTCYRMGRVDPERARRMALRGSHPVWKALGLAGAAQGLTRQDPSRARLLMTEAMVTLSPPDDRCLSTTGIYHHPATVTAWLLQVAEQLNPMLGREYLWRAVSFRFARPVTEYLDDEVELADIEVASMLARYDRSLTRTILEVVAQRWQPSEGSFLAEQVPNMLIRAATLVDPAWACSMLDRLPDPTKASIDQPKNDSRMQIALMLATEGEERWTNANYWDPAWPDGDE